MELNAQIKKYRTELNLSQEELAEKVYVTRQTISNWENGKSYPDIHSLLLLSSLFNVSLDQLIKGDIETMKEIINEQEVKQFNYYGNIFSIHFLILIITAAPLFFWLERYAFIPFGVLFAITMFWALKVEKIKKENDIQTYKEIVAFTEGKKLDELHKAVEVGKRPYQNVLKVIISAVVTTAVCFLIGFMMHIFLN
ncbi:MAG: helix-turn-helix transcriptional regulator [Clostridiales bacterium]|nr:helix-turn-helix transcriptional regulator [Clostridiales bacterium]